MYGDTAAGRRRVAQLRERALDIRSLADSLVAQAESVPWHGRAAEAMRNRIKERAAHLRSAAGQHETAADSLSRHLGGVDEVKDAIENRQHRATVLIEEARTRVAHAAAESGTDVAADTAEADEDATLVNFVAPPAGHKDWLSVELPGLGEES
ncbi:MAG: hypothetical protein ACI379_10510 [Nocardioides sp.]|uniref:hypothetical protein n=1 Tax=Nocardioides sp. TaxID=35761 RepID=UPI003F1199AF